MDRLPPAYDATPGGEAVGSERHVEKRLAGERPVAAEDITKVLTVNKRERPVDDAVSTLEDIDDDLCRQYARDLARADDRDDISPETARRYFAYVRSFLTWAVSRVWYRRTRPRPTTPKARFRPTS